MIYGILIFFLIAVTALLVLVEIQRRKLEKELELPRLAPLPENPDDIPVYLIGQLVEIFNHVRPTIPQTLVVYGNLGYHLGASIAGYTSVDKGPNAEELKQAYYTSPTVDIGLMIQGLMITGWEEDFLKQRKISNLVKRKEKLS